MLKQLASILAGPLDLNKDQRKLVSGILLGIATFAATQGVDSLDRDPFLPALTIGFMLCAAGLAIQAVLALRNSKGDDKDECCCRKD